MQIVPRALGRPHHCAVFPHLGQAHAKGYFDTGNEIPGVDPHIYVAVESVEQMARQIGWLEPLALTELEIAIQAKDAEITELQSQVEDLERFRDSVHSIQRIGEMTALREKQEVAA